MAITTAPIPNLVRMRPRRRYLAAFLLSGLVTACFGEGGDYRPELSLDDETASELAVQALREVAADSARHRQEVQEVLTRALPSRTPGEQLWTGFRAAFPYHVQVLALSDPAADGTRTLIASEPPPDVSLEDVLLAAKDVLRGHEVRKQPLGYDGWVGDVVLSIGGSDEEVAMTVSRLTRLFYRTTYKAYVVPLPARRPPGDYPLNLDVTSAELQQWVGDPAARFSPVEGGPALPANDVLEGRGAAVYAMSPAPLVAWWIPAGTAVDASPVQAREFSLDADIVVGAISDERGTLVLGRQRVVPVDVLPPLRFETIRLLARANTGPGGELAQSYERNHRFAGRMNSRDDWAPIYLSPELIDTEYGSLLNITDQLLKSWSNHGTTRYVNFSYPDPPRWPFEAPIYERLGLETLTYNWNTSGAAYAVEDGNRTILALGHSGALPVSYLPGSPSGDEPSAGHSAATKSESEAYAYFGGLNDPNLTRVVQYAALYQIFSAFTPPAASAEGSVWLREVITPRLEAMLDSLEWEIGGASDGELRELGGRLARQRGSAADREEAVYRDLLAIRRGTYEGEVSAEFAKSVRQADDAQLRHHARVKGRRHLLEEQGELAGELINIRQKRPAAEGGWRGETLSAFAGLRRIPQRYAEAEAKTARGWIHTPVVVVSSNSTMAIGGHNLGAGVTRIEASSGVPRGQVRVRDDGGLMVNPADASHASQLAWKAARSGESGDALARQLNQGLASAAGRAPRIPGVALRRTGAPPRLPAAHLPHGVSPPPPGSARGAGWRLADGGGRRPSPGAELLVERKGREYVIGGQGATYHAFTAEDATDVVVLLARRGGAEGEGLRMELRGFARHEGEGFTRSVRVRAAAEGSPREISALVGADEAAARLRGQHLNFREAKVTASEIVETARGPRSTVRIEVPSAVAGEPGGLATIHLQFRKGASRRVIEAVTQRLREMLARLIADLGSAADAVTFNFRLNAELKSIRREFGVDIQLDQEFRAGATDLYFSRAPLDHKPDRHEPAGSLLAE